MVSILVGFLGFFSGYVKHSAENIMVAISSNLIKFGSIWIQFIELIWVAIHAASTCVHNALPSKTESNSRDTTITSASISSFMALLNLRSRNFNQQMMASLFRVLHAILKYLKHNDSELKDDFICLSIQHILKMPWESVHQVDAGELVSLSNDTRFSFCNNLTQSGILTCSLLQLLGSLLEQTYLEDTDGQDMYVKFMDRIPKLAAFLQERDDVPKSLYQYSKHKILVVMMRLKPYTQQDCSHIVRWLKLLRHYFQDLLHEPISQHIAKTDNCLEGSPFLLNMDDMLFSILLQLLDAHVSIKMDSMEATELIGAKLLSNIFEPVHLFHLLLLLLHYDHLVLVDYLISKDVGVDCAQYLLRCLRLVSQSWHAFADGSVYDIKIEKLHCKRQRRSKDINGASGSSNKEHKNGSSCGKEGKNTQKLFFSAKVCLLSLKRTVEDLQKRGLFPYNPKPILRSLGRFEELCEQG